MEECNKFQRFGFQAKPLTVSLRVSKTIRPTVCGEDFLISRNKNESKTKNQNPEFAPFLSPKSQNWCVQSRTAFAAPSFRVHVVSAWLIIGLGTHWKVITACGKATFLMTGQMEKRRVQYLQPLKAYGEWGYHYIFLPERLQKFEQNEGWFGWRVY